MHDSAIPDQGAYGQGAHYFSVADVNGDGKQDIVYGAATLNSDGKLLYRTGLGHGDSLPCQAGDIVKIYRRVCRSKGARRDRSSRYSVRCSLRLILGLAFPCLSVPRCS